MHSMFTKLFICTYYFLLFIDEVSLEFSGCIEKWFIIKAWRRIFSFSLQFVWLCMIFLHTWFRNSFLLFLKLLNSENYHFCNLKKFLNICVTLELCNSLNSPYLLLSYKFRLYIFLFLVISMFLKWLLKEWNVTELFKIESFIIHFFLFSKAKY